jgi:hypothetical protein
MNEIWKMAPKSANLSVAAGRWFALDADKNWSEKYFLWFSIYWLGMMGWCVASGAYLAWTDIGYATFGIVIA